MCENRGLSNQIVLEGAANVVVRRRNIEERLGNACLEQPRMLLGVGGACNRCQTFHAARSARVVTDVTAVEATGDARDGFGCLVEHAAQHGNIVAGQGRQSARHIVDFEVPRARPDDSGKAFEQAAVDDMRLVRLVGRVAHLEEHSPQHHKDCALARVGNDCDHVADDARRREEADSRGADAIDAVDCLQGAVDAFRVRQCPLQHRHDRRNDVGGIVQAYRQGH
mmetsp:Transcript_34906/g.107756  ORF Transcript_34906/g.107756 Transcript_34906/m.107756 type:complete len:224 (+) Transcript_34906:36-707(+)